MTTAPTPNVGGQPDDDHTDLETAASTTLDRFADEIRNTMDHHDIRPEEAAAPDLSAAARFAYDRRPLDNSRLLESARATGDRADAALERAKVIEGPPPHPRARGPRQIIVTVHPDVQDAICTERFGVTGVDLVETEAEVDAVLAEYATEALADRARTIDTGPWRDRLDQLLGEVR